METGRPIPPFSVGLPARAVALRLADAHGGWAHRAGSAGRNLPLAHGGHRRYALAGGHRLRQSRQSCCASLRQHLDRDRPGCGERQRRYVRQQRVLDHSLGGSSSRRTVAVRHRPDGMRADRALFRHQRIHLVPVGAAPGEDNAIHRRGDEVAQAYTHLDKNGGSFEQLRQLPLGSNWPSCHLGRSPDPAWWRSAAWMALPC